MMRRTNLPTWLAAGLLLLFAMENIGTAQAPIKPKPDTARRQSPAPPVAYSRSLGDAGEPLTAADVLRALRRQRPENKVIAPTGRGRNWNVTPTDTLFPEGYALVNQPGELVHEGDWWVFRFREGSGISPMKLLPNAIADPMVRTVAEADEPYLFVVSGETTVFHNENFLLLHLVLRHTGAANPSAPDDGKPASGGPDATGPAPTAIDGDIDDVMGALQAQKPFADTVTFSAATQAFDAGGSGNPQPTLLPHGAGVIERPARMVRDQAWWTLVFESDSAENPEPPIKVLPNRNLEIMTEAVRDDPMGLVFIVSGRVTVFDGENYLLARAVRRRVANGNLSK